MVKRTTKASRTSNVKAKRGLGTLAKPKGKTVRKKAAAKLLPKKNAGARRKAVANIGI